MHAPETYAATPSIAVREKENLLKSPYTLAANSKLSCTFDCASCTSNTVDCAFCTLYASRCASCASGCASCASVHPLAERIVTGLCVYLHTMPLSRTTIPSEGERTEFRSEPRLRADRYGLAGAHPTAMSPPLLCTSAPLVFRSSAPPLSVPRVTAPHGSEPAYPPYQSRR